jgi:hypothetical protein
MGDRVRTPFVVLRCPSFCGVMEFDCCLQGQMRALTPHATDLRKGLAQGRGAANTYLLRRTAIRRVADSDGKTNPPGREMQPPTARISPQGKTAGRGLPRNGGKRLVRFNLDSGEPEVASQAQKSDGRFAFRRYWRLRSGRGSSARNMECKAATSASSMISYSVLVNSHANISTNGSSILPLCGTAGSALPGCERQIEQCLRGIAANAVISLDWV